MSVVYKSCASSVGEEKGHNIWKLFIGEKDTCKIIFKTILGIIVFEIIFLKRIMNFLIILFKFLNLYIYISVSYTHLTLPTKRIV